MLCPSPPTSTSRPPDVTHVINETRPSPFFALFRFRVLYWTQTEEQKNGGGLGTRLGIVWWARQSSLWWGGSIPGPSEPVRFVRPWPDHFLGLNFFYIFFFTFFSIIIFFYNKLRYMRTSWNNIGSWQKQLARTNLVTWRFQSARSETRPLYGVCSSLAGLTAFLGCTTTRAVM